MERHHVEVLVGDGGRAEGGDTSATRFTRVLGSYGDARSHNNRQKQMKRLQAVGSFELSEL